MAWKAFHPAPLVWTFSARASPDPVIRLYSIGYVLVQMQPPSPPPRLDRGSHMPRLPTPFRLDREAEQFTIIASLIHDS